MSDQFDAIVIGSGIGGLTAARLLSAFGHKRVLVLEQHTTLGGLTHVFSRPGVPDGAPYEFATGVHYLGRNAETASVEALLAQLTEDRVQWQALADPYDVIAFPGWSFAIPNDEATYKAKLCERFPQERAAIERYFRDVRRGAKGVIAFSIVKALPRPVQSAARRLARRLFPLAVQRTQDYLDRHIAPPELRALLAAQWGDYGRQPSLTAFGIHALVVQHYLGGAIYPIGGPAHLSAPIIDILRRDGSELKAGQFVREILVENGRAVGVSIEDGHTHDIYEIRAPIVVSDVGVRNTFAELLPQAQRARLRPSLLVCPPPRRRSCCSSGSNAHRKPWG